MEASLEPRLVGDITGRFLVPQYQRGYRWGPIEVRQLLDDIWGSLGKTYYLQPIVVKRHGDEWELVDGQQRLTTLYLIFQYMHREGLQNARARYTLRYSTREASADYLESIDPGASQDNIDFFHIFEAYSVISEWFATHGERRQWVANRLYNALFEDVKVIWYEAPDSMDATTLFTRLNVGRIPLTDAELVKALLMSRSRVDLRTSDRSLEIAAQWDAIERDLRDPELWAFITGSASEEPTHISLLLDTVAGGPVGRDRPPFHTFETLRRPIDSDPQQLWNQVVELHALVLGWYSNRDLFHKIGYLVAEGGSLTELIALARGKTKSMFESELDALIRDRLNLSLDGLQELTYQSPKASRVLLLMNVETVRSRRHSTERYSFKEHATGAWSLEHIHAQNAERLNREDQWISWLRLHRAAIMALEDADDASKALLLSRIDEALASPKVRETTFRPLEREITEVLSVGADTVNVDMDSIANLALLDGGDNAALSNSVFAVKRAEILARDRVGSYIPVCTRNVFLKYYTPADEQQLHFWGSNDRTHYLHAMGEALAPYLKPEEDAQ